MEETEVRLQDLHDHAMHQTSTMHMSCAHMHTHLSVVRQHLHVVQRLKTDPKHIIQYRRYNQYNSMQKSATNQNQVNKRRTHLLLFLVQVLGHSMLLGDEDVSDHLSHCLSDFLWQSEIYKPKLVP